MEAFLVEEEITAEDLRCSATVDVGSYAVPMLCGAAFKNKGVQPMLDAVVDYLPSPDIAPTIGTVRRRTRPGASARRQRALRRLVFKIMTDPTSASSSSCGFTGHLTRAGGAQLTKDRKERIGRILQMHANHREDHDAVCAGDIVAVVGLKHTTTGDTLCAPEHPVLLEALKFPEPVIHVAVEPKTKADQDKLSKALFSLSEEDPTFRVQ